MESQHCIGGVWDKMEPLYVKHYDGENFDPQVEQWPVLAILKLSIFTFTVRYLTLEPYFFTTIHFL